MFLGLNVDQWLLVLSSGQVVLLLLTLYLLARVVRKTRVLPDESI